MDTDTVIWIVVAVLVALVIIGLLAVVMNKRKTERRRNEAGALREDAHARTAELQEADLHAREAKLEADRASLEAQQAAARAQEADQVRTVEAAGYEDQLREADRLDPGVDTGEPDYSPDTRFPEDTDTGSGTDTGTGTSPAHRADGSTT
jgi:flagellar biosynthesis/type III secretory pathway M-ring protein FliF/YscJ